jgi:hypothetical protein
MLQSSLLLCMGATMAILRSRAMSTFAPLLRGQADISQGSDSAASDICVYAKQQGRSPDAASATRTRGANRDGRFWHRILLAKLSAQLSIQQNQDRSLVYRLAKAPAAGKRTTAPSVDYRGFVISWPEPPPATDKWTANISTEDAFFLRKMSRGPSVITGRSRTEMLARARSWINKLIGFR